MRFAILAILATLALGSSIAHAQTPSEVLRTGNAAAVAGDWAAVSQLIDPLLRGALPEADLAEAHRLAGLAAYFQQRTQDAEVHFLAYLRLDLDAHLDPSLYPPEAVQFFEEVRSRHAAELRARRPKPRRMVLNLIPMAGQFQNGERTKGLVIGGLLGAFVLGNVTTYLVLRSWCTPASGPNGSSVTCDRHSPDRFDQLRTLNIATGLGAILTYVYNVYDGVEGYRRRSRELVVQPFVAPSQTGGVVGVAGAF